MDIGSGRSHAVQDHVQQDSRLHPQTTTHFAYRACGIRLASTSTSEPTWLSFGREAPTVGDGPSAFIPRLTHQDSIELVDTSATSPSTTRFGTLSLKASRRRERPSRSTEIDHGLRRTFTLHQAEDRIHWFCHL